MSGAPLTILDIAARGVHARVSFNDVTMLDTAVPIRLSRSIKLNAWANNGSNRLSASLGALPATTGDAPPAEPLFSIRLRQTYVDAPDEADQLLFEYEWPPGQPPSPAPAPVFDQTISLSTTSVWSWQSAYRFSTVGAGERADITYHLERLLSALADRNVDTVISLQTIQLSEQALALSQSPEAVAANYRAFLTEMMSAPEWTVRAMQPLSFDLMAEGRIVHVTGPGGVPPIQASTPDSRFAIDPYIARVAGVWAIVR